MISNTARLLSRQRLERLLRGLRLRTAEGAEQIAHQLESLRAELAAIERDAERLAEEEQHRRERQHIAAITAWDERLQAAWDEAERLAFEAAQAATTQEAALRALAKRQSDEFTAEVKKRIADIEKRFMISKDKAARKLGQLREQIERLAGELGLVEHEAATFLAQRGVSPPSPAHVQLDRPPATTAEAIVLCGQRIRHSRELLHHMMHHRILRSIESAWFWLLCLVVGGLIAAIIGGLGLTSWVLAAVVGIILAVVLGIAGLVAVHPWARRMVKAEYPQLAATLAEGRALLSAAAQLAMAENDAKLRRTAQKRDERMAEAVQWRENALQELNLYLKREMARIRAYAAQQRAAAKEQLGLAIEQINAQGRQQEASDLEAFHNAEARRRAQLAAEQQRIEQQIEYFSSYGRQRIHASSQHAVTWIQRSRRWCQNAFPPWDQIATDQPWQQRLTRPVLPLGTVRVEQLLPQSVRVDAGGATAAPVNFEPLRDQYLTIMADPAAPASIELIKTMVLRALTTLPPGKTQIAVIDPPGLGRDYGWLMHLGDYDPELVSHRVWTQPVHIAKLLTQLAQKAEDFIQQSLRNQYASIEEYNRDAGPLAEPFRLLIWSSFPVGLDDQSWKPLQSLLDTGARCGIIPIFLIDPAQPWEGSEYRDLLMRRGLHVSLSGARQRLVVHTPELEPLVVDPPEPPGETTAQAIVHQVGKRALQASRVEVPLSQLATPRDQWWQADSSASLDIPIGQSGVGRVQSLKLGVGTAQHAIVAGKTGSGKSTLLHAIITSAAVKYSPERLRLVLLDFKKGVEFQAYSQAALPHADIIGIESQREFGLSALEYVDQCMQRRGQLFRSAGVQDLHSWNLLHPDEPMPRMLIVIDEFQELFVEEDKISSQVSLILDRIVRQGRSFGVHAVLSSQTLAGAYSLPRTTMGQMAVRIALQCDAADAQLIFTDDNPAASRLNRPGQAVYNDQGGRVEGNQSMQIGWLTKKEMLSWLGDLPSRGYRNSDPTSNLLGRAVIFEGNRAATWNREAAVRAIEVARVERNPEACWCVVGESVAISPAVVVPLTDQAGRNLMIVGGDDEQTASAVLSITSSFIANYAAKHTPHIALVQGAKPTDAMCLALPKRMLKLPAQLQVADVRGADAMLADLHAMLKSRMEAPENHAQWQPILLNILNIGRLRSLRPEDEFGLGSFGEAKMTPDKHLEELLREGPSHRIHVLVTAENANVVSRWLSRMSLREIEIRMLMQMSANDSTHLIDSVAAAHLGSHVMLLHDDATSTEVRFRPYEFETLVDLVPIGNGVAE